ncbi:MAG: hypothetical protein AAF922_08305 [Pseudomonadota bacterium]
MKPINLICAAMAATTALSFTTTSAQAQSAQEVLPLTTDDLEMYRSWDKWQIFSNNTRGHCLGTKSDDSGVLQMGVTADETMGYVGVFVKADVEQGESNAIAVKVGDEIFVGETSGPVGDLGDGWHGGYILANNKDFRKAIEANNTMTAFPDQPYSVDLNIKGANNAIYEISQCSQKLGS